MLAAEAHEEGLISSEEKFSFTGKRMKPLGITMVLVTAVAVLITIFPLRSLKLASLHRQYHEHYGTVVGPQTPITTLGAGTHYLVHVRYPDWYGRMQTIPVMDEDELKAGESLLVVVSKTKSPWTADGLEERTTNPRDFDVFPWVFMAVVLGLLVGVILGMYVSSKVEERQVAALIARKKHGDITSSVQSRPA